MRVLVVAAAIMLAVDIDFANAGSEWVTKATFACDLANGVFSQKNVNEALTKCGKTESFKDRYGYLEYRLTQVFCHFPNYFAIFTCGKARRSITHHFHHHNNNLHDQCPK